MELKKSKIANLERFRVVLLQAGLVCSLLFAIVILSWNFKVETNKELDIDKWKPIGITEVYPPVTFKKPETPKPPAPPQKKPEDIIKIVDDKSEITEPKEPENITEPEIKIIKPDELKTGEIDPLVLADRMPATFQCSKFEDENLRRACTQEFVIKKVYNYLQDKNIKQISGKVFVHFVINKYGKIADVKILQGIYPALDREVEKAVYSLGKFEPAIDNGLPVPVKFTLPIDFRVN